MTSLTDSSAIFSYHREMISIHGPESSFALGWLDQESQVIRFKALAAIADLSGRSVLDAGCGYGDLLPYLSSLYSHIVYTGIEQIPEFLNEAIRRYGNRQGAVFIPGNFTWMDLPVADYVLASGSLNYRSADPDFIYKTISKLFASCRNGFAFNLLKQIIPNGLLIAYDERNILNFCRTLSPTAKLINNYAAEDFTIFMYH